MVNAGRILIIAQGEWSNLISYGQLDLVSRNQVAYLARRASVGVDPATDTDMTYWQPFGTVSDIATTTVPGLVMPDGTTITIDATGLIKANVGISDITNVAISSIANDQVLIYNSTTQKWENETLTAAGVTYNNTGSGLSASTSQAAIDEVNTKANKSYKTDDAIEASIADDDYIPFYDTSASAKKRILKSNLAANVDATLSASSTSPVQNSTISKALGTVETIGGTASKAYSTGDLMLASTGQLYSVTADISQGGSITSGGNVEATDNIVSQISNLNSKVPLATTLWTGTFSSGSITIQNAAQYSLFEFILQGGIPCVGTANWGIGGYLEYAALNVIQCGYRFSPSRSGDSLTLTITANDKGGAANGTHVPVIAIKGIA